MTRDKIDNKYKWDLKRMYKDSKTIKKDEDEIDKKIKELVSLKGMVTSSSDNLYKALDLYTMLNRLAIKLYVYSQMDYDTETKNDEKATLKGKYEKLIAKINENQYFLFPEILNQDYKTIEKLIKDNKNLELYEALLKEQFRFKEHLLNDNEEELMSRMGEVLGSNKNIYGALTDSSFEFESFIVDGKEYQLNEAEYVKLLKHKDVNVRIKAFNNYYKVYDQFKSVIANTFKYSVKNKWFIAKSRKYKNPLEMTLFHNDINVKVYDNLVNAVNKRLDIMHRYVALRKEKLNLDEMHFYDIYVNMIDDDIDKKYTYEEGIEIVKNGLKPLGEDYLKKLDYIFGGGIVDVYHSDGKRSGAYSFGVFDSDPYILLNHRDSLDSVMTMAHEAGHSIHSLYQKENNPYIYAEYPIFLAEIASTVNEVILSKYILATSNDNDIKKAILNELMDKFKGTLYRQTQFAEFEKKVYEAEAEDEVLSAEFISNLYLEINKKYYGNDIVYDDYIKLEWARIPHFYSPFYVYQYATGISIACFIADKILKEEGFIDKYIKFLSSGSDMKVIDIVSYLGIDLNDTKYIDNAFDMFEWAIDEFIKLN